MPLVHIANDHAEIIETNYWSSPLAAAGLCYLSGNAGTWRLLVPQATEHLLAEMQTGKRVSIEPSLHDARCWDIVFEDGTSTPFSLAIDKQQVDRVLKNGTTKLAVWTTKGKVLELDCAVAV